ncbi:hypothetical protein ADEAN_000637400 [Angomonas deanei]|uniref:Uncharacterized protein n=1 Tax=Angomonas deanei TaxID=59799 RepID=A0A7G2CIV2_9TRYP|nr:hypothetical protein ADEAN_000637400 [Angomonas deanei]
MNSTNIYSSALPPSPVRPHHEESLLSHKDPISYSNHNHNHNMNCTPRSAPLHAPRGKDEEQATLSIQKGDTPSHNVSQSSKAPIVDEVDTQIDLALKNYFLTIQEKDDDIFRLYEDNKRMKQLVGEALKNREEITSQFYTQSLLVTSLQTEVREKQLLLEAQEEENKVLRECVSKIRVALQRPSELQYSTAVLVEDVEALVEAQDSWSAGMDMAKRYVRHFSQVPFQCLVEEEARGRRTLLSTEETQRDCVNECALFCQQQLARQEAHRVALEKEQDAFALERENLVKRQRVLSDTIRQELQQTNEENRNLQRQVQWAGEQLEEKERELYLMTEMLFLRDRQTQLLFQRCTERMGLLETCVAEQHALAGEHAQRGRAHTLQREEHYRTLQANEARLQEEEKTLRSQTKKLQKIVEVLKPFKNQYETLLSESKTKEEQHVALQKMCQGQHEKLKREDKKLADLQKRYTLRCEENDMQTEKMKKLNERLDEKNKELHQLKHKQTQAEKKIEQLQKTIDTVKNELEGQKESAEKRLEKEIKEQQAHDEARIRSLEDELQERIAAYKTVMEETNRVRIEMQTEVDRLAEALTNEKRETQKEASQWIAQYDTVEQKLIQTREQLQKEREVRALLESQQTSEKRMIETILKEKKVNEQPRLEKTTTTVLRLPYGANDAVEQEKDTSLQDKIGVLEAACRESTAVIAGLREALYYERLGRPSIHNSQNGLPTADVSFSSMHLHPHSLVE